MAGLLIVTARWGTYGVTARPAWGTKRYHLGRWQRWLMGQAKSMPEGKWQQISRVHPH
jgi:hypothetical protein